MPKQLQVGKQKIFHTRIVYNSTFKHVNRNQANKNIRTNVEHVGKVNCVRELNDNNVVPSLYTQRNKSHIIHDQGCNIPVMNRFNGLHMDEYSHSEEFDKVDDTNEVHCIKQVQKRGIIKDTAKKQTNYICETVQVGNNGKSCHDSVNECQNKTVVEKNTERVDNKQGLQDVPQHRTSNLTYVGIENRENTRTTEENLSTHTVNSRDIPCRVVDHDPLNLLENIPI